MMDRPFHRMSPSWGRYTWLMELEDRRLAGAVRADDGEQLAFGDLERDVIDGLDALERQADGVHLEQGSAHDNHRFRRL